MAGSMTVETFAHGDLVFDVTDAGPTDGAPVVLLHGFPQHLSSWDLIAPVLHEAGLRTLAPDQRGYSPGARPRPTRAYRLEHLVADVEALVAALGQGPVHLVGHDWGAAVAWATALRRPHLVRSLTAVSVPHPSAFAHAVRTSRQGRKSWYMLAFQPRGLAEALLDPARPAGRARLAESLRGSGQSAERAERDVAFLASPGAFRGAVSWYRGVPHEIRRGAGPVTCAVPTAMVWGDRDPFCTRRPVEATAAYVQAPYRLDVLPGVGHWVPEQAPRALADAVLWAVRTADADAG